MKKIVAIALVLIFTAATAAMAGYTSRPMKADTSGGHYTETISTGANGASLRIPALPAGSAITVTLIAGANTGKFQITTSSDAAILAGTCTWQDWDLGDSTGTVSDVITGPVTGIRGVSVSGEVKIEIVY